MSDDKPTNINENEERIANDEKPVVAYRDPETGETKEREPVADVDVEPVVFPEPTGTDGPSA